MDLLTTMVEHHIHVVGQMIDRADALIDEQLDATIELSVEGIDADPTIRSLLSRLVGQLHMWNCAVANRPYDFSVERQESIDSIRRRLSGARCVVPRPGPGGRRAGADRGDLRRRDRPPTSGLHLPAR